MGERYSYHSISQTETLRCERPSGHECAAGLLSRVVCSAHLGVCCALNQSVMPAYCILWLQACPSSHVTSTDASECLLCPCLTSPPTVSAEHRGSAGLWVPPKAGWRLFLMELGWLRVGWVRPGCRPGLLLLPVSKSLLCSSVTRRDSGEGSFTCHRRQANPVGVHLSYQAKKRSAPVSTLPHQACLVPCVQSTSEPRTVTGLTQPRESHGQSPQRSSLGRPAESHSGFRVSHERFPPSRAFSSSALVAGSPTGTSCEHCCPGRCHRSLAVEQGPAPHRGHRGARAGDLTSGAVRCSHCAVPLLQQEAQRSQVWCQCPGGHALPGPQRLLGCPRPCSWNGSTK